MEQIAEHICEDIVNHLTIRQLTLWQEVNYIVLQNNCSSGYEPYCTNNQN
jgi:hypothetical protein